MAGTHGRPWTRIVQSPQVQRLINHPATQRVIESAPLARGTAFLSRINDRLFDLAEAVYVTSGTGHTERLALNRSDGWQVSGTNLPTQFNFRIGNSTVHVAQNATKHIFEEFVLPYRSGATPQTLEFGAQIRLASLQRLSPRHSPAE